MPKPRRGTLSNLNCGAALADILTGRVNPSAKLPIRISRHSGQIQMIYNYKPLQYFHTYRDGDSTPLYHFGFGFSYSTFRISAPELSKSVVATDEPFEVSVTVTNESGCAGTEVVQLYIRDLYSSVTRPVKEFARVELEQGDFEILAGSSSRDCDLQETTVTVK